MGRLTGEVKHTCFHLLRHQNWSKQKRLAENREYLKNSNVRAYLAAIAAAEGGDYDLMYGGVLGKKNDRWRFRDFSTHPGPGIDGRTTAAGRYQINKANWKENGEKKMGLTDFLQRRRT